MKNILILMLLGLTVPVRTQVVKVVDATTLRPLEYATVSDPVTQVYTISNQQGLVDLSIFADSDSLIVAHIGYLPVTIARSAAANGITLQPAAFSLDDVVISANRWEQDSREVPNRIVAIDARDIAFNNPQTAADMLQQSGAVFVQKSQFGGGSPMIRGFAANRLLMVVDGVRMNTAIFRSGNIQNVLSVNPNALEGVEVVYGPGSLMYGSDALGGVMDFHTITPELATGGHLLVEGNAFTRYASANEELSGNINLKLGGEKWGAFTSIGYTSVGDLRMGSNGPEEYLRPEYVVQIDGMDSIVPNPDPQVQVPSDMRLSNFIQKLRYKPNADWDLTYGFYYSRTSEYDRYDRLIEYRNGLPRSAVWYYGPMLWNMHNLQLQHVKSTGLYDVARLTMAYQLFEESRVDRSYRRSLERIREERVDAYSLNLDFQKKAGLSTWFYGAELVYNAVGSVGTDRDIDVGIVSEAASRYPDGSSWQSYALYASNKYTIRDNVTLQTGLRYNQVLLDASFDTAFYPFPFTEASLNRGALTGSVGLAWLPATNWQVNVNGSTGFRSPNIDDIGKVFDSEPGNVVVPNPALLPEYLWNGDLGIIWRQRQQTQIQVTGFYSWLNNAIVRRDFSLNGADSIDYDGTLSRVQALQNIDAAFVYGLEFSARWNVNRFLTFSGQLTWTEGKEQEETSGDNFVPLRHAPPLYATTRAIFQVKRFRCDVYADYNAAVPYEELAPSEKDKPHLYAVNSEGMPYSPSWATLNIMAGYQIVHWLNIQLGMENLTDVRYRPYSSGIVAPGRNIIVALRSSF
jgi:hemoglobin/transferrin/lactoferrin receptor protein